MNIIYLDQYLVSDLADEISKNHVEISELLFSLKEKGILCCPLSPEHYMESSNRNLEDARKNDIYLNKLSNNYCFYPNFNIVLKSIQKFIRNKPLNQSTYIGASIPNIFKEEDTVNNFKDSIDSYSRIIKESESQSNHFRKIINSESKFKLNSNSEVFEVMKMLAPIEFTERMNECFEQGYFEIRGDKSAIGEIPNWIDVICEALMRQYKFDEREMVHLMVEFKENGFKNIPALNIVNSLRVFQAIKHKTIQPNDEIDNIRISGALPISDIMFTDKKRKSEIKEMKLDKKYKCKVLSGTEKDLNEFKKWLKNCR